MTEMIGYSPNAVGMAGLGIIVTLLETFVDNGVLSRGDARGVLETTAASFAKRQDIISCRDATRLINEALLPKFTEDRA